MNRLNTDERGGILVLSAVLIPVFLLMAALVVDGGNWFTHKRQLQNRADAGALAAGVEYLSQLQNCVTSAGTTGVAIAEVAKRYTGTEEAIAGTKYNQQIAKQSELTVKVNANSASTTAVDGEDGGGPCADHDPGDSISPSGGYWTDVKVRETNLGTLFSGFGLDLPAVSAQARVDVKQIIGIRHGGLPLVTETGDKIECVWARFVRASDGSTTGFTVTPNNPILLTGGPSTWTANVTNLQFTNSDDDVAIQYYAGSRDGSAPCDFASANKRPLPHAGPANEDLLDPVAIDWLNVYDTGAAPGLRSPPVLRAFSLTPGTCGGPGFLYTASTDPSIQCQVGFSAWIDTGVNNVTGEITIEPMGTAVDPVTVSYDTTGGNPNLTNVGGTITIFPNEVDTTSGFSQDYTQAGPTYFKVGWHQTSGNVGTGGQSNCPGGNNCTGTFQGETVSGVGNDVQQATYTAHPLGSTPLTATSLSLSTTSFPALGQTGAFTISMTHTGIDQEGLVLVRDSVQSSENRTRAVWCGGSSNGSPAIEDAVVNGCQVPLVLNQRQDSCAVPPGGWPEEPSTEPLDCIQLEQGNKTGPIRDGTQTRFTCTDNNWVTGGPLPSEGDPRWAYIVLTGFGRIIPAPNNGWLPIEGLVRIYVTGWGGSNYSGATGPPPEYPCRGVNDPPPRGFDGHGAQIWGHLVDIITLSEDVITGDEECNLDASVITCKPELVR